jgi:hypothetical protein
MFSYHKGGIKKITGDDKISIEELQILIKENPQSKPLNYCEGRCLE